MIAGGAWHIASRSTILIGCAVSPCSILSRHSSSSSVLTGTARAAYHWYFLAQPAPFPETLIGRDPDFFLKHTLESWCGTPGAFTPDALSAYREAFRDPATIHATCEDYRAGIGPDCEFDAADRKAGRKITAPTLALWGAHGRPNRGLATLDVWKSWCDEVRGEPLDCGHFIPEEAPEPLAGHLREFFSQSASLT